MLENETEQAAASIPAAQRRVSAEELTRAVNALEEAKAAELQAGVAPIGQVVEELGLQATPEEVWAEVQKQRAEKAAEAQAAEARIVPAVQAAQIGRQVRRGWRGMRGWVWIAFWCTGGFGLLAGLPHLLNPSLSKSAPGQTITISGDATTETINVQGKDVVISGDSDTVTLQGEARSVTVEGDADIVTGESARSIQVTGDSDTVKWTSKP